MHTRYGSSVSSHNQYKAFALKTRHLAIHVAIKSRIQHLAKLTRLGSRALHVHAHKNNTCGMAGNMSCLKVNLGDFDGNGSDDFISEEINFCDFR